MNAAEPELREFLPGKRPPLEAQLLDLADEIAYNTADLDDAFFAELFPVEELARVIPVFGELAEQVDTQFPGAPGPVRFWEVQRQIMNFLIGGLIDGTLRAAERAGVETMEDVRSLNYRLAQFTPEAADNQPSAKEHADKPRIRGCAVDGRSRRLCGQARRFV